MMNGAFPTWQTLKYMRLFIPVSNPIEHAKWLDISLLNTAYKPLPCTENRMSIATSF